MHWLQVGDDNNRYFHQAAKQRQVHNSIRSIQRDDESMAETQNEIKIEAENYFHAFMTQFVPECTAIDEEGLQELLGFVCDEEDVVMLTKEVIEEEVKMSCLLLRATRRRV
ncbi:hypothetical protein V5N11_019870 [Cardamine amara subsp. amara]|uniref:Uncharacterized protein n=1 Tax=Cardamine amara subsp. amara TaxID=228776 RepID=A0ABD1A1I1_CARAN